MTKANESIEQPEVQIAIDGQPIEFESVRFVRPWRCVEIESPSPMPAKPISLSVRAPQIEIFWPQVKMERILCRIYLTQAEPTYEKKRRIRGA